MGEISMIGLDIAKNVFHIHGVDASGTPGLRRQLRRGQVEKFFAKLAPTRVGLEACGSAHHWARVIGRYGHQVRLMPPGYVKAYVKRNKNDGRDAEAICEALGRPTMRFVAVKSIEQQATLSLHSTRSLLVRQRTMAANALRGMLSELGIVAAQGTKGLRTLMQQLEQPSEAIPELMRNALVLLARQWQALDAAERALEQQITRAAQADAEARRLMAIPAVGPMIASTLLAKVPDPRMFRSGRDFAAWIGLTGRDHGTGGKHRVGRISKQGDRMLRTLLINGASAYLLHQKRRGVADPWLRDLLARRPYKVVMVALATRPPASSGRCWSKGKNTGFARAFRLLRNLGSAAGPLALHPSEGQLCCDGKRSGNRDRDTRRHARKRVG